MSDIKAHYDGKVFVPHEPVDLGDGEEVVLHIERGDAASEGEEGIDALAWMAENAIDDDDLPTDLSTNLDHYLYGTPKREP